MSGKITIFGYGSLINENSLKKTVPNAQNLRPAILEGFKRSFDTLSSERVYGPGVRVAALGIRESENHWVNGVAFDVSEEDLEKLKGRESVYKMEEVTILDQGSPTKAQVFLPSQGPNTKYEHDLPEQEKYLHLCLEGARMWGEDFFTQFVGSTFIGEKLLTHCSEVGVLECFPG